MTKTSPNKHEHNDKTGWHRISNTISAGGDEFTVEFVRAKLWGDERYDEYISVDNGLPFDDNRGIFFNSVDEAIQFHNILGKLIADVNFYKASID